MKKYSIELILVFIGLLILKNPAQSATDLAKNLAGRILLQVEKTGEAWYVYPVDQKRYYLGRPDDAYSLMNRLGIGITNADLNKIPVGLMNYTDEDSDEDGLANRFEEALDTDPQNADTDGDDYDDKTEVLNNYSPLNGGRLPIDEGFTRKNAGKIFLQVKDKGQAWYINPADNRRYYLGRPADAWSIMKNLSLGITNANLDEIMISQSQLASAGSTTTPPAEITASTTTGIDRTDPDRVFASAAAAIRSGNKQGAVSYFSPAMEKAIEYTMDFLDAEGNFNLGNIMSGAKLTESTDAKKTYTTEVYFSLGGYKVPVKFYVEKQKDGSWLLANL
ncbi:MAG: hypothetical protein MUC28_04020 [Planctomycetes bacterium]|jgi:hypothetical protein|nr:hypothetical protein [Planctomycetota bacterium]